MAHFETIQNLWYTFAFANRGAAFGTAQTLTQKTYELGLQATTNGEPLRILDVGCGTGNTLRGLAQYAEGNTQAVGVSVEDFSTQSSSKRTRQAGDRVVYGDGARTSAWRPLILWLVA